MLLLEIVPVERVLEAFRCDQKVRALGEPWPDDRPGQVTLLRNACRPVDYILDLTWGLYSLDRDELLSKVRPVWSPPSGAYSWTLKEMFSAYTAGRYKLEEPNTVSTLAADMRKNFRESDFVLIGYQDFPAIPEGIRLEDGHNRVTAAFLADVIPLTVKMYIGKKT